MGKTIDCAFCVITILSEGFLVSCSSRQYTFFLCCMTASFTFSSIIASVRIPSSEAYADA